MNPSDSQLNEASVLLINAEGIIMDARDPICAALGWTPEELINKGMNDLFEYGADLVMSRLQEMQNGTSTESEFSASTLVRKSD